MTYTTTSTYLPKVSVRTAEQQKWPYSRWVRRLAYYLAAMGHEHGDFPQLLVDSAPHWTPETYAQSSRHRVSLRLMTHHLDMLRTVGARTRDIIAQRHELDTRAFNGYAIGAALEIAHEAIAHHPDSVVATGWARARRDWKAFEKSRGSEVGPMAPTQSRNWGHRGSRFYAGQDY